MDTPLFETTNRRLEGFLHVHDIHWAKTYTADDGMTTWCYVQDEEFLRTLCEFRQIAERRANRMRLERQNRRAS